MNTYGFFALLSRMKYINRWGLMRANRNENLSEHTLDTAFLVHALCAIANKKYNSKVNVEAVITATLYHDASEILTGDMPTPVKYNNSDLKIAYKKTEADAQNRLVELLPVELKDEIGKYIKCNNLTEHEKQILKAADRISAIVKCIEEEQAGNNEFIGAKKTQLKALNEMHLPEVEYFIKYMLPCYKLTLDELVEM